jgi:hypothetical protein
MGTDIHAMVDVFTQGEWVPATAPIWPNARDLTDDSPPLYPHPMLPRNYGVFSLLADVVNRTGRRGVIQLEQDLGNGETIVVDYDMDDGGHEPIIPLAMPRGLAPGVAQSWVEFCEQEAIHSATWFYASELRPDSPLWQQRLRSDGIITEDDYRTYKATGKLPENVALQMGGEGVLVVSESEYEAGKRGERSTGIRVHFDEGTVKDSLQASYVRTFILMGLLAPDNDFKKVRLNVAFDS